MGVARHRFSSPGASPDYSRDRCRSARRGYGERPVAFRCVHYSFVRQAQTRQDTGIQIPAGVTPYPSKSDHILDKANADGGGSFGRLARTGMMNAYMQKLDDVQLCGIKTTYWRLFLKAFQESTTDEEARLALENLKQRVQLATDIPSPKAQSALSIIAELECLLDMSDRNTEYPQGHLTTPSWLPADFGRSCSTRRSQIGLDPVGSRG